MGISRASKNLLMGVGNKVKGYVQHKREYHQALEDANASDRKKGTGSSYDSYRTIAKRHPEVEQKYGERGW